MDFRGCISRLGETAREATSNGLGDGLIDATIVGQGQLSRQTTCIGGT